jgi:hypothetical protein
VLDEDLPRVPLVEGDCAVEAFPTDRADQALDISILPGERGDGRFG